jgi:hypothetical protein
VNDTAEAISAKSKSMLMQKWLSDVKATVEAAISVSVTLRKHTVVKSLS